MIKAFNFLTDIFYIRFGKNLPRQVVSILIGFNCAPLIAALFLYFYETQFVTKLFKDTCTSKHYMCEFSTFRYLDDILALNNTNFKNCDKDIQETKSTINCTRATIFP